MKNKALLIRASALLALAGLAVSSAACEDRVVVRRPQPVVVVQRPVQPAIVVTQPVVQERVIIR
jgi:hypothetical protein